MHENIKFKKKSNIFLHLIFQKFKKWSSLCFAPSFCKWNKIINFVLSVKNCRRRSIFHLLKLCIFYANHFLYIWQKKSKNNYVSDLILHIYCLEHFSLWCIIKIIKKKLGALKANNSSMNFFFHQTYIFDIFWRQMFDQSLLGDYLNSSTFPWISTVFQMNAI